MTKETNPITYLKGDATLPQGEGLKIIAHIVNNEGGWGSGFVVPLGKRCPTAEQNYRLWAKGVDQQSFYSTFPPFSLGETQFVTVGDQTMIANMCAQNGFASAANPVVVDYGALTICLRRVASKAKFLKASIHMPRIGCGLGGGKWSSVENCIEAAVGGRLGIDFVVYDLPKESK